LILAEYFTEYFEKIWLTSVENAISFVDAEKMENAVNHAEIGAYLAEKWLLPQPLVDAIRHHHSAFSDDHRAAAVISAADFLVNTCRPDPEGRIALPDGLSDAPAFLQPHLQTLSEWYPGLQGEIITASQFFTEP
jgi:HD-like signal output (HDOD) protein